MRGQKSGSMFGNTLKVRLLYMRSTQRIAIIKDGVLE
jgi:hypothetical protein